MSPLEPTPLQFWAKLGHETWPEKYHPVVCHLIDVAAVARSLWDEIFRPQLRRWLTERLAAGEEACARWLAFWSGAHDIGKIAACFQDRNDCRTDQLKQTLTKSGFAFPFWNKPHGTISAAILAARHAAPPDWLPLAERLANRIAVAVGGHHGLFPPDWADVIDLLRSNPQPSPWQQAHSEILSLLARFIQTPATAPRLPELDDQAVFMVLAGLTSVADWIGSNQDFFPPAGNPAVATGQFDLQNYCQHAREQARFALVRLGWLGCKPPGEPRSFQELFTTILRGPPRPLQLAAEEIGRNTSTPSLVLIEAPMGEGKTEAAWYIADAWDRRGGQGTYVALPTMATSNQMFDRVAKFLQATEGKHNLMLLHGKAALNDQFEKLKYTAYVYDDDKHPSAVVAEEWFAANKKHGLLAPYGVGTIDQVLLAVLQTKHVFVRLFGLAGKCVILDEVHAYDAYMTTLLERLLRWLAALGCPVVLLSATLPRDKRLKLLRAYAGHELPEPQDKPYPRLTTVAVGNLPQVRHVKADPARARTIRLGWLDEVGLAKTLRESLAAGGCAAVIRNTVGLAQETYLELKNQLEPDKIRVELFHARFPFGRRMKIERRVLRRYGTRGKQFNKRRQRVVLVASQVVEQSLDLDFDLMVSDVAPVDLALQRAGRLHRHERGSRPAGVADPQLWLIEPPTKDGLPHFKPYDKVYARFVLLRSYIACKAVQGKPGQAIRLPDDLEGFIEQVYGGEGLPIPGGWESALDHAQRELVAHQKDQRRKAKNVMIYCPNDEDLLRPPNAPLDEDNPEAHEKIRAATRDTEPSIQLVLVYRIEGRDFLDDSGREPFDEADKPNIARTRRLLDNEVTINHRGCMAFYGGQPVPRGWRERGMLQHHRVVRVDERGKSLPGDFVLRVDSELGVRFQDD
jgi:CRISPR-associated endonuclease/helicase Cas3